MSEMTKVRLEHETAEHFKTVQSTADRGAEIIQKLRVMTREAEQDDRFSPEHKRELTVKAQEEAQGELDRLRAGVASSEKAIAAVLAQVTRQPADSNEALLREQQMGRAWERVKAQLDAGTDSSTVIGRAVSDGDRAVSDGDRAAVDVLGEELPAYLRANTKYEGNDAERLVEGAMATLREAEKPMLSRLDATARDLGEKLEKASYFAGMAFNDCAGEVAGKSTVSVLPRSQTDLIDLSAAA
jgi:hypothetical protein